MFADMQASSSLPPPPPFSPRPQEELARFKGSHYAFVPMRGSDWTDWGRSWRSALPSEAYQHGMQALQGVPHAALLLELARDRFHMGPASGRALHAKGEWLDGGADSDLAAALFFFDQRRAAVAPSST